MGLTEVIREVSLGRVSEEMRGREVSKGKGREEGMKIKEEHRRGRDRVSGGKRKDLRTK